MTVNDLMCHKTTTDSLHRYFVILFVITGP